MKLSARAVPWILAGITLAIVAVLAHGLYQGELVLPTKGVLLRLPRATHPVGFLVAVAVYATLAAGCVWLLIAVLRAGRQSPLQSARSIPFKPTPEPAMPALGQIQISQEGRGGNVTVTLTSGSHCFWWEFGGSDCIAFVDVPTAQQWPAIPALAPHPRTTLLAWLAGEVSSRQCPGARIVINDRAIEFYR